jgi:hypothetical protein
MRDHRCAASVYQHRFLRAALRRRRAHIPHEISRPSAALDALKCRKSEIVDFFLAEMRDLRRAGAL